MTNQQSNVPPPPPQSPPPFHPGPVPPTSPEKWNNAWPWIAGGITALVLLFSAIGVAASVGGDERPVATPTTQLPSQTPTSTAPTAAPTPSTIAPSSAAPATSSPPPKPKPKPTYKALSERQWKLIAKNPDEHIGETYVVYGVVTQFDAATGDDMFRADVAHKNMAYTYDYETNTLLIGSAEQLKNLVEDDEFRANVTVLGSFTYDTQIGGSTTVPLLQVDSIKIL